MKTSNRLLIGLAVLLIVIPIVVVAINVRLNYQNRKDFYQDYLENSKTFDKKSEGFKSLEMNKFIAINIPEANDAFINIKIIKDQKSGIKIAADLADQFGFIVDNSGTLQITMKNNNQKLPYSPTILIYSNNISKVSVAKVRALYIDINADSLILDAKNMNHLSFESTARLKVLKINADHVNDIALNSKDINAIEASINESEFRTAEISYNQLTLNSKGESKITITGDEKSPEKYKIDNLKVNTFGSAALSIENIKINNISGNVSDETTVQVPIKYLKQMFMK